MELDPRLLLRMRDDALDTAATAHSLLQNAGYIPKDVGMTDPSTNKPMASYAEIKPEKGQLLAEGVVMGAQFRVPDGGGMIRYVRMVDGERKLILDVPADTIIVRPG